MAAGAQWYVLCAWMPFLELYKKLQSVLEEVPSFEDDTKGGISRKREVFEVDLVLLHNVYTSTGELSGLPCMKKLSITSVVETAQSFWLVSLPLDEMSCKMFCLAIGLTLSSHPEYKNEQRSFYGTRRGNL